MTYPRSRTVVLTGALGFAGRYVAYGFLRRGWHVVALVRGDARQTAEARGAEMLADNAHVGDRACIHPSQAARFSVCDASLTAPGLGMDQMAMAALVAEEPDLFVHVAACLSYDERDRELLWRSNVEGTRAVAELAETCGAPLAHVSTAYLDDGTVPTNPYLASKAAAEAVLHEDGPSAGWTILRYPTLIGDSRTGYTTSRDAFYEYVAAIGATARRCEQGEVLRFDALPDGVINLMPVDLVASATIDLALNEKSRYRTLTIADDAPPTAAELAVAMNALYDHRIVLRPVAGFDAVRDGTRSERLFARMTRRNVHFAARRYDFNVSETKALLGRSITDGWRPDQRYLAAMIDGFEGSAQWPKARAADAPAAEAPATAAPAEARTPVLAA